MPEYMRQLGYETQLLGKWHLGYETDNHTPTHRGFDNFFGYYNGLITYFNKTIYGEFENGSVFKELFIFSSNTDYKILQYYFLLCKDGQWLRSSSRWT